MAKKRAKKHNKKRNTAFLFEVLVREMAKTVVTKDKARRSLVVAILKEHFGKGTLLFQEMELFRTLNETTDMSSDNAEKLITEAKKAYAKIDQKKVFAEQGKLISKINKQLSSDVFNNFVPNYKSLASIAQIFSQKTSVKEKVLLESVVVEHLCSSEEEKKKEELQPLDQLTYKTFVSKFNEKYGENLLSEQKELVTRYVMSFADNGISLKLFLNEELGRLKQKMGEIRKNDEIDSDSEMKEKAAQVVEIMESYKKTPINDEMVQTILKIQELVKEVQKEEETADGN